MTRVNTGYWDPNYWPTDYWDADYWPIAGAPGFFVPKRLNNGYWNKNYWLGSYWDTDYWPEFGSGISEVLRWFCKIPGVKIITICHEKATVKIKIP